MIQIALAVRNRRRGFDCSLSLACTHVPESTTASRCVDAIYMRMPKFKTTRLDRYPNAGFERLPSRHYRCVT